jgi:histidinol phosphatase-like PHP family hydrolase
MIPHVYDLHTHTFNSDGVLSPAELIRQADRRSYAAIGIADHMGSGGLERRIEELVADCEMAMRRWDIIAVPGIELTHIPPEEIQPLAEKARSAGAKYVIVHGETPFEGVVSGTNRAAVECPFVNILAHPGHLAVEDAARAAENGTYIEVSGRKDHCLTNGLIARIARDTGAKLLVNSDAHGPEDLFNLSVVKTVALGAGLNEEEAYKALYTNPRELLRNMGYQLK